MDCTDKLRIVYGDVTLGVQGADFDYIFSYVRGGPESIVIKGKEWLYRTPQPTFWRATTDNDRGNGFPLRSGQWMSADLFIKCTQAEVTVDGKKVDTITAPENNCFTGEERAEEVCVCFSYETITVPSTCVKVSYTVKSSGSIRVDVHYYGKKGLPELPVFGIRFIMPTKAVSYCYEGLSGETYPDRMAGGEPGIYEVEGLPVTPYLVPQDCGVHMQTKWVVVRRNTVLNNADCEEKEFGLKIAMIERQFAFSCIPYTAQELENATHQEELPPARRTVLSVLGAVRGVGGIDSWGADVESAYHIDAMRDICYSFEISSEVPVEKTSPVEPSI